MRVLVTPRSMGPGTPAVRRLIEAGLDVRHGPQGRQPTVAELGKLVPGCHGWIAGVEQIPGEVLTAATDLRVISRNGAGADAIDRRAADATGIEVRTAPGANARGVAELTLLLVLAALRHLPTTVAAVRDGRWERPKGRELRGRSVGLIGLGAIGRQVAELVLAMDAKVVAADPALTDEVVPAGVTVAPVERLLAACEIVSLHLPAMAGGPLLTADMLARMPVGAVLVNTARAQLVDGTAVLAALESGHLAAYAVDAFEVEPPPVDALLRHPHVIATPHIGAATQESSARAADAAVTNLLDALEV